MRIVLADIETDGLESSKFHVGWSVPYKSKDWKCFFNAREKVEYLLTFDKIVFHHGLGFDRPALEKLSGIPIPPEKVIDTFVVSRLANYSKFSTHGLDELGRFLKVHKGEYTGGWETCTEAMVEYCRQDVEVLVAVFDYLYPFITDPANAKALRVEHDIAHICWEMQENGFKFDTESAQDMLGELETEIAFLEAGFSKAFPPKLVEDRRVKYRINADGTPNSTMLKSIKSAAKHEVDGDEVILYNYQEFNPGSPKQRVDVLWEAGWKPVNKTDGHKKWLKKRV